jgi:hypothetical protein
LLLDQNQNSDIWESADVLGCIQLRRRRPEMDPQQDKGSGVINRSLCYF